MRLTGVSRGKFWWLVKSGLLVPVYSTKKKTWFSELAASIVKQILAYQQQGFKIKEIKKILYGKEE
jgi:DNA-binding transcriptional MerR regulator